MQSRKYSLALLIVSDAFPLQGLSIRLEMDTLLPNKYFSIEFFSKT